MASGTAPSPPRPAGTPPPLSQADAYIERRLAATQRQVRAADISVGVVVLLLGALSYLFAAALLDHWLIPGGFGFWGRVLLLAGLLGLGGWYLAAAVVPAVTRRINPVYAAHSIEQSQPSLKNSLVNFLLLRGHQRGFSQVVYGALRDRAARDLKTVRLETVVDRTPLVRLGYLLVAVAAIFALYLVLSPKNPLVSAARVLWPWAEIAAPTRVRIADVDPGSTTAFYGDHVSISAAVQGLRDDEEVFVYFTTDDGQSRDQAVPMQVPAGDFRYRAALPPASEGLQQGLEYYLAAGDGRTPRFRIDVETAPTIVVEGVRYEYPDYTGLPPMEVPRQGAIRALEGTRVTVRAAANLPIESAEIDLNSTGRRGRRMEVEGQTARGSFTLTMRDDNPAVGEYESYQLLFTDAMGRRNQRPIRYRIETIPDEPPVVQMVDPPGEHVGLPLDGELVLRVRAEDPDFALRRVALLAEREGEPLSIAPLLDRPAPEPGHEGPFEASYRFRPQALGVSVGDDVSYRFEAVDNKEPVANRAETAPRWITIVDPQAGEDAADAQRPDPAADAQQPGDPAGEPQPDGAEADGGEAEEASDSHAEEPPATETPQPGEEGHDEGMDGDESQPAEGDSEATDGEGQAGEAADAQPGDSDDGENGEGQAREAADAQPGESADDGENGEETAREGARDEASPETEPAEPEAVDGEANPGEAFERILRHRDRTEPQPTDPAPQDGEADQPQPGEAAPQDGDGSQPAEQPDPTQPSPERAPADQPLPGEEPSVERPPSPAELDDGPQPPTGEQQLGAEGPGEQSPDPSADPPVGQQPGEVEDGPPGDHPTEPDPQDGPVGAEEAIAPEERPGGGDGAPQAEQQFGEEPGGEETPDAGDSQAEVGGEGGAGRPSADPEPTPQPMEDLRERPKTPPPIDEGDPTDPPEAHSPSTEDHESDSVGEVSGDQAGGGEEGGGQRAPEEGLGSAGETTPADEGSGAAPQAGEGPLGDQPGGDLPAERSPDAQDDQPGVGTGRPADDSPPLGDQPPTDPPADEMPPGPGQPADGPPDGRPPEGESADGLDGHGPGLPQGGGLPPQGDVPPPPPAPSEPGGDDVNREYAEKATELALEHLSDQLAREEPDPDLLRELGWSREELERFYSRWEAMRRQAAEPSPEGERTRRQLDEALRNLGLRSRGTQIDRGAGPSDDIRRMHESRRIDPPPQWRDLFRAYTRGVAGSRE